MAPSSPSSSFFLVSLLLLSLISGGTFTMANGQRTWCVAKPSSDAATLLANINFACSQVDCRVLQKGCLCFSPDNLINHASIAMNLYYRAKGCNKWNCDFRGSGLIVVTDPTTSGLQSLPSQTTEFLACQMLYCSHDGCSHHFLLLAVQPHIILDYFQHLMEFLCLYS